jgi:hypothetical protein
LYLFFLGAIQREDEYESTMSLPSEWQIAAHPNDYDVEKSTVITVLKPDLFESVLGKWLWKTFGDTAFYEVCNFLPSR